MKRPLFIALLTLGFAASCGGTNGAAADAGTATCAMDSRALAYLPNLTRTGKNQLISVKLLSSMPGPPIKGNNSWAIQVLDAANQPMDGAKITVVPFMPDHGHGTPIKVQVTPKGGNGTYQLTPLNLFMSGLWQITITVTPASGGASDYAVFDFCIEG